MRFLKVEEAVEEVKLKGKVVKFGWIKGVFVSEHPALI